MRHHVSLFLTASFLFLSQGAHGSTLNNDDDSVAAPAVAAASRAPVLNPNDEFSTLPTHVLRQIGDILLENDPKSLGRFLKVSRTTNALKDQIFHTTQTMGTVTIAGKERTVMHYAGANNTKDRVLELLGRQTGNPELFKKDHTRDYQNWSKTDLLNLLKNKTLKGALDHKTRAGQAYFEIETLPKDKDTDTSLQSLCFFYKRLRLCPPLRHATDFDSLDLSTNQLTSTPDLTGLTKLVELYLDNNQLITAPVVRGLSNLKLLNLQNNQLSTAPVLTGLRSLEELYLRNNQLIDAPVVTGLTNLQILDLSENQITAAPDVTGLTKLKRVILDPNLCGDQNLLKTLRVLKRERDHNYRLELLAVSKDPQGDEIETEISLN